jgi:hypothetical protein
MSVEGNEVCDLLCQEAKAGLFLPALSFITVRVEDQRVITQFSNDGSRYALLSFSSNHDGGADRDRLVWRATTEVA